MGSYRCLVIIGVLLLAVAGACGAGSLAERLQGAKAGETVVLPAGRFAGGVVLPKGVSLRGAGYGKTVIDGARADAGLSLTGAYLVTVSDLTVEGGTNACLALTACREVTLARVRLHGSQSGLLTSHAVGCRVENSISDGNWTGMFIDGEANTVVNCTVTGCAIGLSFNTGMNNVAFNNCITDTGIGIRMPPGPSPKARMDYNLYDTRRIGIYQQQPAAHTVGAWARVSAGDRHAVQLPVRYRNPAAGDFTPVTSLSWSPDRCTTTGWGSAKFYRASAPLRDMNGKLRPTPPGVGAVEAAPVLGLPADGTFTITGEGLTSAGLFTPAGTLVAYLFHDLPLPRGAYAYRLPARTWDGKPLVAGQYGLRLVTSALTLDSMPRFRHEGGQAVRLPGGEMSAGEFTDGAARFVVQAGIHGDDPQIVVYRAEEAGLTPVLSMGLDPADWRWVERRAVYGHLEAAPAMPLTDADGMPLRYGSLVNPWAPVQVRPNGDLLVLWGAGDSFLWTRHGLDARGIPVYRAAERALLPCRDVPISPYDGQANGVIGYRALAFLPDGGYLVNAAARGSRPGGSAVFGVGSDLAAFTADGGLRWWRSLRETGGICGLAQADGVVATQILGTREILLTDPDGLGLGTVTVPGTSASGGLEMSPGQEAAYLRLDGPGSMWYRLGNSLRRFRMSTPITVSAEQAQRLAAQALPGREAPVVRVPQLARPLPVDGTLAAWRQAVPVPQVLLLPEPGKGIERPEDCSALVRLAHDGQDLYLQVIRFDNTFTCEQPYTKSYLQDATELMLNGYFEGTQWSIGSFAEIGAGVVRRGGGGAERLFQPAEVPLSVTELKSARDVPERRLLEMLYGVDLAGSPVVVTEIKLPITAKTYEGIKSGALSLTPGSTAWLGIQLDDSDTPGTDAQHALAWPDTFGTFTPKEMGAVVVFE